MSCGHLPPGDTTKRTISCSLSRPYGSFRLSSTCTLQSNQRLAAPDTTTQARKLAKDSSDATTLRKQGHHTLHAKLTVRLSRHMSYLRTILQQCTRSSGTTCMHSWQALSQDHAAAMRAQKKHNVAGISPPLPSWPGQRKKRSTTSCAIGRTQMFKAADGSLLPLLLTPPIGRKT